MRCCGMIGRHYDIDMADDEESRASTNCGPGTAASASAAPSSPSPSSGSTTTTILKEGVSNSGAVPQGKPTPTNEAKPNDVPIKRKRLQSLDTFRGLSITLMIFANTGSGGYYFLEHAPWNGMHLADFVFPWFIWIMGVSMAFAIRGQISRGTSRRTIACTVAKRTLKLFFLGLCLNGRDVALTPFPPPLRIPGVLQRFAAAYGFLAGLEIIFTRIDDIKLGLTSRWAPVRDLVTSWRLWLVNLVLVLLHLCLTFLLPVPGCLTGYTGPGGLHDDSKHENCTGGAAGYIDRLFYGENHIYQHPTIKDLYKTQMPFDPEGLLGNLTSIFLTFLGLVAGRIIVFYPGGFQRLSRFVIWGASLVILCLILCQGSLNDGWIPINKNLWSLSFALATGAAAFVLLAAFYYVIDERAWWSGTPLRQAGMNAITLYLGHQVLAGFLPFSLHWSLRWIPDLEYFKGKTHLDAVFFSCWGTGLWLLVAYLMFKNKTFISL